MRVAIYVRVSTQEQAKHGLSVDNQVESLTQYCEENGHTYTIYNDAGMSAHKKYTHRPSLLRLLGDVEQGKIDMIVFTKLDRWFRSVADYHAVQSVLDEHSVPWKAIHEDYETVTSSGKFKVNIMLSVAQAESDRKSEVIRNIHEYRRSQGKYVGTASIGYKVVDSQLIIDEEKRDAVTEIFRTYLSTFSMAKTLAVAKEHGIVMSKGHMSRWMQRGCYHGDAFGYRCEAYITPKQHDEIIKAFASHRRTAKGDRVYLFSALVKCGHCGLTMVGQYRDRQRMDGSTYTEYSYRCPSYADTSKEYHYMRLGEVSLEKYMLDNLEPLLEGLKIDIKARKKQTNKSALLRRKNSLKSKLERLKELYVDGDIPKAEYLSKRDALQSEMDSIVIDEDREIIQLPTDWHEIYDALDRQHRSNFWHRIIDRIIVTRETKSAPQVIFKSGFTPQ